MKKVHTNNVAKLFEECKQAHLHNLFCFIYIHISGLALFQFAQRIILNAGRRIVVYQTWHYVTGTLIVLMNMMKKIVVCVV